MTDLRGHVDTGLTKMRGNLDATAAGQQQIADLLTTLIADRPEDTSDADRQPLGVEVLAVRP
jgi:hypothetical protein